VNRGLRRSIQGLTVLLVFSCVLTTALIVNQGFAALLSPIPVVPIVPVVPTLKTPPAVMALDAALMAKMTGLSLGAPSAVSMEEPPSNELRRSTLGIRLLGTLVAQDPRWSMASIHEVTGDRAHSLMLSDVIQGARVYAIERERILLLVDGELEYIDGAAKVAPVAVNIQPATAQASGLGQGIRETGPETYAIPREDVTQALTHMSELSMQARVVPAFRDGQPVGFKVFSIREGSLYARLGLRDGDVLQRINGLDLNGPDKALEAFTTLRDARRIELQIERGGAPVRKVFDIR
jgi:general secretion pathway protein C